MKKKTNVELENELKIVKNQRNQLEEKSIRQNNTVEHLKNQLKEKQSIENDYIEAFKHQRDMEKIRLEIKKSKIKQTEIGLQFLGQAIPPILELIVNELSALKSEPTAVNTKKS